MIFLMLLYTYECFHIFKFADKNKKQNHIYAFQRKIIFLIHADGFLVLFLQNPEKQMIGFYLMQLFLFLAIFLVYRLFYKNASNLVLNNMVMLLTISMIELTRLSFNKAFRQFVFILAGFEHCIADMFYFTLAVAFPKAFPALIVMTLGNAVGGNLIPLGQNIMKKLND